MAESMIASGKRDREDLGLASTEDLGHEPGAQRLRVAEEFGEWPMTAPSASCHRQRREVGCEGLMSPTPGLKKPGGGPMCAMLHSAAS
jgi:hypothetical protein